MNCAGTGQNPRIELSDLNLLKNLRDRGDNYIGHGFRSSFRGRIGDKTYSPGEVAKAALTHAATAKVEAAYQRTDHIENRKSLIFDWKDWLAL